MEKGGKPIRRKRTVLVTALGTTAATAIVSELNQDGNFYIIGADINEPNEIVTSRDVNEFYVFPSSVINRELYLDFVLNFCHMHHVDYYFAIIDEEIADVLANREKFEALGIKLCMVNDEVIKKCHYKNIFSNWIESEFPEIAIKQYNLNDEIRNVHYPLFLKPIEGRASIGCQIIKSYEYLQEVLKDKDVCKDVVIQEYIDCKNIITVDVLRNRNTNQLCQAQRIELLRNPNGCGTAVKMIYDEVLAKIVVLICEKLNLNGIINIEFFASKEGYKIIEINPRFSSGYAFTYMSGGKFAINAIKIADGKSCDIQNIEIGKFYAKRYEAYEM